MTELALILLCYFIGSTPFGLLLGKKIKGIDIREYGSGNLGATNAGRVLGKKIGVAVLVLDILKGFVPLYLIRIFYAQLFPESSMAQATLLSLCGGAAIAGHMFPIYLRFKGGKGVATSSGVLLAIQLIPFLYALTGFACAFLITRYVSIGSMVGALIVPVAAMLVNKQPWGEQVAYTIFCLLIAFSVVIKHRSNIKRLLRGEEIKLDGKSESLDDIKLSKNDTP